MVRKTSEYIWWMYFLFVLTIASSIKTTHGCQMDGVIMWPIPVSESILDTHAGYVLDRGTTDIEDITTIRYGEGLNAGPYLEVSHAQNRFQMWVNDAYRNYEENEVAQSMSMTVTFRCTGGTTNTLVFLINVIDTNNNAPQFRPNDIFEYVITTPLAPGFLVTGCFNNIVVRDIDLTTQRIDFGIEENPYIDIAYDSSLSTTPKEFKAVLRTKTFIRTIPELLTLQISATDVDLTGDPPRTTYATVHIKSDPEFEFPEEPVFSRAFYLANYDEGKITHDAISLRQGFDDQVQFSLDGDYATNFQLNQNGNQITLSVRTPLSNIDVSQILLIVKAEREYTSGASATVIVQLPEEVNLEFERAHYSGQIENNILRLSQLTLIQGFEGSISARIIGEHASYFSVTVQGNSVTITMAPLTENIIRDNNFIYLEVIVSAERGLGSAVVTLEIIKDDNTTPVFSSRIYTGNYDVVNGLNIEPIYFVQGYDDSVSLKLDGDSSELFEVERDGAIIKITSSALPVEIHSRSNLILSLEATKPRTVGANAAIVINLPEARELIFEESTYKGTLQDNILTLETIVLSVGYQDDVSFNLIGEYKDYFATSNVQNRVALSLLRQFPESVILANSLILLTLEATGQNAVTTTTNVLLEIIKEDLTTPLFSRKIYYGSYIGTQTLDIENINLVQGFDDTVTFRIEGEHSQFFAVSNIGNNVVLSLRSQIPSDVIYSEKVFSFNVIANKALTVGANAAILIRFPAELTDSAVMRFSRSTYVGSLENERLSLENIVLDTGYADDTQFELTGEYESYFTIANRENTLTVSLITPLPSQVMEANDFLVLEIEASRDRAISATTSAIIHIIRQEIIHPVFSEAYYRGVYTETRGLEIDGAISLSSGYDDTVTFKLEGESARWFTITQNNNLATVALLTSIPQSVLNENTQLLFSVVAAKPNAISGRAILSIDLPRDSSEVSVLRFAQNSYIAFLQNGVLESPNISLENSDQPANINIIGDYESYFRIIQESNVIRLTLVNDLPIDIINNNNFIVLNLEASYLNAISGYATIIIDIITDSVSKTPVFSEAYYFGEYSEQTGLVFEHTIRLIQGFDENVSFTLSGDDAQWFRLVQIGPNNHALSVVEGDLRIRDKCKLLFNVVATKAGSLDGQVAVVISLKDYTTTTMIRFTRDFYKGAIDGNTLALNAISLEGYSSEVTYSLIGDYAEYFQLNNQNGVFTLHLGSNLPDSVTSTNNVLVLTVEAQLKNLRTHTTVVLEIITKTDGSVSILKFEEAYYLGSYSNDGGLNFEHDMRVTTNLDDISFNLNGDNAQWFGLVQNQNSVSLKLKTPIPSAVIANNRKLVFTLTAQRPGSALASATVIISLVDEYTDGMSLLGFERVTYVGSIEDNTVTLDSIALTKGFSSSISFTLFGELVDFFTVTASGSTVTIGLHRTIPEDLIPANRVIVLELRASASQAVSAYTTIVLTIARDEDSTAPVNDLVFDSPHYTGSYSEMSGLVFETPISLSQGYDAAVQFSLEGDNAQWFSLIQNQNSVSLTLRTPIPTAVIANNRKLIFSVAAQRPGSITIRTTIIISLSDEPSDGMSLLGFERVTYVGSIEDNTVALDSIALTKGFSTSVSFTLFGELVDFFTVTASGSTATIGLHRTIPEDLIPSNRFIVLELRASAPQAVSAYTTIVLTIARDEDSGAPVNDLVFDSPHYTGSYTEINGLVFDTPISLSRGYDEMVIFYLEGDNTQWFNLVKKENIISLTLAMPIPSTVLANNRKLIFNIAAQRPGSVTARATIIILLLEGEEVPSNEYFDKVLYEGLIQGNIVRHEQINLFGFLGENIRLIGEYASLFGANVNNGVITIQLSGSIPVPTDVTLIALELHALRARSVLLLTVESTENPNPPLVVFGSSSYALRVEITRTGLIGRVHASADNGEAVTYSLRTENVHLVDRLSVNNDGELHLSAPASSGVYTFEVVATTVFTRASALAIVHLTVDAATICGDDLVMPPLLVIDRDEESPHRDLVALNPEKHEGCRYTLTNRWPVDQTWLYVDDTGLHTRAIDREHESIAFMKVSQVQVELILHCANDKVRSKRSIDQKTNSVDDYGSNHWILTDSILYNSRRSFVNLIVNDINDNAPVFVGKENEPIAVGYPISDLEEVLRPRSLAELKASDADIGENAVLRYWSHEPAVVVSPTTGFVHVRSGARLQDNQELTVHATDRNGEGLTGHIKLLVKLLDVNNIAVVTVQNSFLDDEIKIISQLSTGVGYEVKALRSDIISDAAQPSDDTRKERDAGVAGTTMQLYIYGLNERQPVSVERLITDINNIAIIVDIVANAISLEDHLEGREICVIAERDTGLLIACILLSILLFIIIVVAVVWSILKRRKSPHYSQFSDKNSIASRTNSLGQLPKTEAEQKPRLYIEDLRKSERKLQEILDAPPLEEVKASTSTEKLSEPPTESIIDIPVMEPSLPIVIQSIDKLKDATDESDDDEFGENKKNRRKSVVTFNENVEKIIHVEDDDDSTSVPGYEIYKL